MVTAGVSYAPEWQRSLFLEPGVQCWMDVLSTPLPPQLALMENGDSRINKVWIHCGSWIRGSFLQRQLWGGLEAAIMLLSVLRVLNKKQLFCGQGYLFHQLKPNLLVARCSTVLPSAEQCMSILLACLLQFSASWVILCTNASGDLDAMHTIGVISCENTACRVPALRVWIVLKLARWMERTTFLFMHNFLALQEGKRTEPQKLEKIQEITELIKNFQWATVAL